MKTIQYKDQSDISITRHKVRYVDHLITIHNSYVIDFRF